MLWELESVEPIELQQVVLHSEVYISKYSEVLDSYSSINCEAMVGVQLQVQFNGVHLQKSD
jgi:hypothetical protein